jgi:hypothetical protein
VHGAALVDPATGLLLAASGGTVPLAGIGVGGLAVDAERTIVPQRLVAAASGARILYFSRLTVPEHSQDTNADQNQDQTQQQTKHWLVMVLEPLPTPAAHGDGCGTWLVRGKTAPSWRPPPACGPPPAPTGRSLEPQPGPPGSPDGRGCLRQPARRRRLRHAHRGRLGGGHTAADRHGQHRHGQHQRPSPDGRDRAVRRAHPQATDYLRISLLTGGALAAIAVVNGLLLVFTVQRPLLRLHLSAARLTRGAVGRHPLDPEDLSRPVPVPAYGEQRRPGRALETPQRQLLGTDTPEEPRLGAA